MPKYGFLLPLVLLLVSQQAVLHPLDGTDTSYPRRGRCFQTIWNWIKRETPKLKENLISGNPDDVRFFLYSNPYDKMYYEEIMYNNRESLARSSFRFGAPWKILIHGYTMSQFGTFPQNVKNAYLDEYRFQLERNRNFEGYNVLVVDWAPLADPKLSGNLNFLLMYTFAVKNVQIVGERVGEMVMFLLENGGMESLKQVHIVGFSLGAHVSGNAGNKIMELSGQKIPRITGLDPAGPNFYFEVKAISSPKLRKDFAKFVDVYHSNQGEFGTLSQLGMVDFYPNGGGPFQPYCSAKFMKTENSNKTMGDVGSCSHNRAPFFFAKSISRAQPPMIACGCDNYDHFKDKCDCEDKVVFGEYCPPTAKGTYYLDISDPLEEF